MNKDLIKDLIDEAIEENPDLFLVDWKISPNNEIEVLVDGDNGIPIDEIVRISRHIEHNLDREENDFSLKVSSPGVGAPLMFPRQYKKNIGRKLSIVLNTGESIEGKITFADEEKLILEWKAREPKPVGKGKHTVEKKEEIYYNNIKKAFIQIIF